MIEPLRLIFDAQGELREAVIECETEVFGDRYGIPRSRMVADYGPYDDLSTWLALVDASDRVVAGCRLVRPGGTLKSLDDVESPPWSLAPGAVSRTAGLDPASTWDVATLFRRRGCPGAPVTAALCHGIILTLRHNGGLAAVAVLDHTVRSLLHRGFGIRWHMMPGAQRRVFMNTPNDPVYVVISDLLDYARRTNPEGYRMFALGVGLEGIEVPLESSFRLPHVVVDLRDPADSHPTPDVVPVPRLAAS